MQRWMRGPEQIGPTNDNILSPSPCGVDHHATAPCGEILLTVAFPPKLAAERTMSRRSCLMKSSHPAHGVFWDAGQKDRARPARESKKEWLLRFHVTSSSSKRLLTCLF